jgi:flavin reductase (DIM6/NTAB) family NADH-FMN oxidoreductase RutF
MLHSSTLVAESVGHIPSGLFIVAVQDASSQETDGYLASFIQQVSFSPLLVSVAIKPGRPAYDLIKAGNTFAINIVGDHDKSFLKHFWKGYDPLNNPFSQIEFELGEKGGVILKQAKSAIECRMVGSAKPGDHEVIFAEVLSSYHLNSDSKPMVHVRKSGADY